MTEVPVCRFASRVVTDFLIAHFTDFKTGGPSWPVPLGRRDGRISSASDARALPSPADPVAVQRQKFAAQGLTDHDLVTLVGNVPWSLIHMHDT
jgi:peroxidase